MTDRSVRRRSAPDPRSTPGDAAPAPARGARPRHPGPDLRDLGDAILLHDPADAELFWNRLEGLRWPDDPGAFDRRLTEILVLFASIGRTPHIWASPLHDSPADLAPGSSPTAFATWVRATS